MLLIVLLNFIFRFLSTASQDAEPEFSKMRPVRSGQLPSIVSIQIAQVNQHICSGNILDRTHVICAAHCFKDIPDLEVVGTLIQVVAGDLAAVDGSSNSRQTIRVKKAVIHPAYKVFGNRNDIAVLSLYQPLQLDSNVKRAVLSKQRPMNGDNCLIAGWRYTPEVGLANNEVLVSNATVNPRDTCVVTFSMLNFQIAPDFFQICASDKSGDIVDCQGDSGGSLYCNGKLAGIVSYGAGCAQRDKPRVYTDISKFETMVKRLIFMSDDENLLRCHIKTKSASALHYQQLIFLSLMAMPQ